jgi:hypothetical protein
MIFANAGSRAVSLGDLRKLPNKIDFPFDFLYAALIAK